MENPSHLAYRSTYESIVQKVEDSDVAHTFVDSNEKDSIEKRGVHLEVISNQLLSSESDAILFYLGFAAIAILAIYISPKSSLGVVVTALVVSWYIGILTVAILRNHKEWLGLLRFLFILCICFIFPDGFLATGLKTIHFPDYGVGKIYPVSIFMPFMWAIPLFLSTLVGQGFHLRQTNGEFPSALIAGVFGLFIFAASEEILTRIPLWTAQNCKAIGNVAMYVLFPEFCLPIVTFLVWDYLLKRKSELQPISLGCEILAAFFIMCSYLGNLVACYMVFDGDILFSTSHIE